MSAPVTLASILEHVVTRSMGIHALVHQATQD